MTNPIGSKSKPCYTLAIPAFIFTFIIWNLFSLSNANQNSYKIQVQIPIQSKSKFHSNPNSNPIQIQIPIQIKREMLATPGVSLRMPETEGSIEELAGFDLEKEED